ncbi:MAG: hypothetical protein SGPRY_007805 [Prymnesium sp.]
MGAFPQGVTMRGRSDGFGAQYAAMMSTYSWASLNGLTYHITPWERMEHGVNASQMFAFVGGHLYGPPAVPSTKAATEKHAELARLHPRNQSIWHPLLREFYYATPKPQLLWGRTKPHLAVHVRRGDVTPRLPGSHLFTYLARVRLLILGRS